MRISLEENKHNHTLDICRAPFSTLIKTRNEFIRDKASSSNCVRYVCSSDCLIKAFTCTR